MKISEYLIKSKRKSKYLLLKIFIPITFIAVIISFITFYGLSTGNLYIGIDDNKESKNISISTKELSTDNKKELTLYDNSPSSPGHFDLIRSNMNEIIGKDGQYDGELKDNIIAASFYIQNLNNNLDVDLVYNTVISDIDNEDSKIKTWNMMFIFDNEYHIYRNSDFDKRKYPSEYQVHDYDDGLNIVEGRIKDLNAGTEKRISIIIWNIGYEDLKPEKFKLKIYFRATEKKVGSII